MSLNLHLLRLFATVARTGSFSRAAEVLQRGQEVSAQRADEGPTDGVEE